MTTPEPCEVAREIVEEWFERAATEWALIGGPDPHDLDTLIAAIAAALARPKMTVEALEEMLRLRDERDAARARVTELQRQYDNSQRTVAEVTRAFEDREARVEELEAALAHRRIQCASCWQAPQDEPALGIVLTRVNVKGKPGVFLCQDCRPPDAAEERVAALEKALSQAARVIQWCPCASCKEIRAQIRALLPPVAPGEGG